MIHVHVHVVIYNTVEPLSEQGHLSNQATWPVPMVSTMQWFYCTCNESLFHTSDTRGLNSKIYENHPIQSMAGFHCIHMYCTYMYMYMYNVQCTCTVYTHVHYQGPMNRKRVYTLFSLPNCACLVIAIAIVNLCMTLVLEARVSM